MIHLFRKEEDSFEYCYNIETRVPLTPEELLRLKRILAHGFVANSITEKSSLNGEGKAIELGPRMNYATAFHTNVSQICGDVLLEKVVRLERSRRSISVDPPKFDRMTECIYPDALMSFDSGIVPEPVKLIPLVEGGPEALLLPGLAMDKWDRNFYHEYFAVQN